MEDSLNQIEAILLGIFALIFVIGIVNTYMIESILNILKKNN